MTDNVRTSSREKQRILPWMNAERYLNETLKKALKLNL
jgi:hypothetical protein